MTDSYYERELERLDKQKKKAAEAVKVALQFITFPKKSQQGSVSKLVDGIYLNDINKSSKNKIKLNNYLSKMKKGNSYISSSKVEDVVENSRYRTLSSLDWREQHEIASKIAEDPIAALRDYANQYISARKQYDSTLEAQKRDKAEKLADEQRRKQDRLQRELERQQKSYETPSYETSTYDSEYPYVREKEVQRPKPFSAATEEERKRKVEEKILEEINKKYGCTLSWDETKAIEEIYGLKHSAFHNLDSDDLNAAMNVKHTANKQDASVNEMMDMALDVLELTTKDLLFEQNSTASYMSLFRKLDSHKGLEQYETAYKKFMNKYRSLSSTEQSKIRNKIQNDSMYTREFGNVSMIVTADTLKRKINQKVSNYIIDNYNQYLENDTTNYFKISHATRNMSIEEIASLYKSIYYKMEGERTYSDNQEELSRFEARKIEKIATLQRDFANIVLTRMEQFNKTENTKEMSETEEIAYYRKRNAKLAAIVKEVLGSRIYDQNMKDAIYGRDIEGQGIKLVETYETKKKAHSKIYGYSKLEKVISKVTGKWSKYEMLIEKEDLTERELGELKSLSK